MPTDHARKQQVRAFMQDTGYSFTEAYVDDPLNQLLCEECGWTVRMVCPGCGCFNGRCSGWRHIDDMEYDREYTCLDCGGSQASCWCHEDRGR